MRAGFGRSSWGSELAVSAGLFALAVALGMAGRAMVAGTASPERGIVMSVALFGAAAAVVLVAWLAMRRWRLDADAAAFGVVCAALGVFVASWFAGHLGEVLFRADVIIWSESPFLNDIIRFRAGATPYGAPADLSSFYYTPGSQLLTYLLASVVGLGTSIPAMRVIQLLYVVAAVVLGLLTARRLSGLREAGAGSLPWPVLWAPLLFLAATNSLTNGFNHLLHNDALGLLLCAAAFLVLVEYATVPRRAWLVAMVLLPPAGFLVKQSLAIWCVLFGAWLLFFGPRPRFVRAVLVGGGLALTLLLYGGGVLAWGADFRYWVIEGLGKHAVSPLRSIDHALQGWAYWAAGLLACLVLVRRARPLVPRALAGLGCPVRRGDVHERHRVDAQPHGTRVFLSVVWLAAALPAIWPVSRTEAKGWSWFRAALVAAIAILSLSGLRAIHLPVPALSADAGRYASEIEREFEGVATSDVLLDHGSWLYLPGNIVQKDRSAPSGEAGFTQTADFGGLLSRIREQSYARILVRDLDGPEFMYDYATWPVSSGVRDSLLAHYRVVRTIPGVEGAEENPWLRPISVLEPRQP